MGDYKWDFDLPEGMAGERLVREILTDDLGAVEVKRDSRVSQTGNVAVEYRSRGKPSGIATMKALWWAFVLDGSKYGHEVIVVVKTSRLKLLAGELWLQGRHVLMGDNKTSEGVLVPISLLVTFTPPTVRPTLI